MNGNYNISNKGSPRMRASHISILWYCSEPLSSHVHLKKRSHVSFHRNNPLATFTCAPSKKPLSKVIVFMCSNKIMKNHCNNNNAFLNAYIIGWNISQNSPSIPPNSRSSLYDRTKWWMEIIKFLLWILWCLTLLKIGEVVPLPLKWCKEPFLHRVP